MILCDLSLCVCVCVCVCAYLADVERKKILQIFFNKPGGLIIMEFDADSTFRLTYEGKI